MSIWDLLRAKDANGLGTLLASGNVDVNQSGAGEQTPLHLASELDGRIAKSLFCCLLLLRLRL